MTEDDYNENGPGASVAMHIKISELTAVNFIAAIAANILKGMGGSGRFNDIVLAAGANKDVVFSFVKPIVRYISQKPFVPLGELTKLVMDKFLGNSPVPEFLALCVGGIAASANQKKQLAIIASIVCKMIYYPIASLINKLQRGGVTDANAITGAAKEVMLGLSVLNNIGANAGGDYLGFSTTGVAGGPSPTSEDQMIDALVASVQDPANFSPGGNLDTTKAIRFQLGFTPIANITLVGADFAANFRRLVATLVIKDKLPVAINATALDLSLDVAGLAKLITDDLIDNSVRRDPIYRNITDRNTGSEEHGVLHWLGYNVKTKNNDYGVGHQLEPNGDNENVMDPSQIKSVDVTLIKSILVQCGRLRFDTIFIRNLIFIVNLYRSIRMKLQRDLTYNKDIIARSIPITRPDLTEFYGNSVPNRRDDHTTSSMWKRYDY